MVLYYSGMDSVGSNVKEFSFKQEYKLEPC